MPSSPPPLRGMDDAFDEIEFAARDLLRAPGGDSTAAGSTASDPIRSWTDQARHEANLVAAEPAGGRLKPVRKFAARFVWPTIARSLEATRANTYALEEVNHQLHGIDAETTAQRLGIEEALAASKTALGHATRLMDSQSSAMATMQHQLDAVSAELRRLRARAVNREEPGGGTEPKALAVGPRLPPESGRDPYLLGSDFYARFEAAHRGDPELIRERLREHVPLAIEVVGGGGVALDLGAGRGEWLQILASHGLECYGVDTSEAFVDTGGALGVDIRLEDAISHLRGLPPDSIGLITAFHLVEHLPLDALVALLDAALRALRPGGALLMETPNPLHVLVGAAHFWIDPTHLRPVHPGLLSFLSEERGFASAEVRFLHQEQSFESADPSDPWAPLLERAADALMGAQDYAVVARKALSLDGE